MKLPSILYLVSESKRSFLRFPFVLISALIGVLTAIYLIEYQDKIDNDFPYFNLMLITALGIPLYFSCTIFADRNKLDKLQNLFISLVATGFLIVIYFTLPGSETTHNMRVPYIRYAIYSIIIHLLVAFIPYLKTKELNGFWNYNKSLFLRICLSVLYSYCLIGGLILALFAINALFHVDIPNELYIEINIVIIGLFNTWFFIAGAPKNFDKLENTTSYPKGLKIFTQYILLPLLILYLFILYSYVGKIIIQQDWPKGVVSYLISCVSILGIFVLLLIYPFRVLKENSWIKSFFKIYYYLLIPLVFVLFIAIKIRISDYGITINRYAIVVLGIWLIVISLYFILGKTNIKRIPQSLALTILLICFGPWSMFSVSQKNQTQRLINILEENNILINGKIKNEVLWQLDTILFFQSENLNTNEDILETIPHNDIKSILDYLDDYHGFSSIQSLFEQNIDSLIEIASNKKKYFNEAKVYMETLGFNYKHIYTSENLDANRSTFYSKTNRVTNLQHQDYLVKINYQDYLYSDDSTNKKSSTLIEFSIDSIPYIINYIYEMNELFFIDNHDSVHLNLDSLLNRLYKKDNSYKKGNMYSNTLEQDELILYTSIENYNLKLEIHRLFFFEVENNWRLERLEGDLFLGKKE